MTSTRRGEEGVRLKWTHVDGGGGGKSLIFCGRHKWMAPNQCFIEQPPIESGFNYGTLIKT